MGESMVEAQNMENKMGESVNSLGVSVSFGKYENDALSWEKWSTFSPNKYLEEVGKCSTPGSVAQKKAFFEAHYKKIAAMKAEAELLDQEKAAETDASRSDDHTEFSFGEVKEELEDGNETKLHVFEEEEEVKSDISAVEGSGKHQDQSDSVKDECFQDGSGKHQDDQCPEEATSVKDENFQDGFGKHQDEKPESDQSHCSGETTSVNNERFLDGSMQMGNALESQRLLSSQSPIGLNSNADKLAEATLVNDESMKLVKQHFHVDPEIQESMQEIPKPKAQNLAGNESMKLVKHDSHLSSEIQGSKQDIQKPKAQNLAGNESMKLVKHDSHLGSEIQEIQESRQEIQKPKVHNLAGKVNPGKLEKNFAGMKKKPASPIPKLPETSVTKLSKPKATPTPLPAVRSSSKKANAQSSSKSKTPSVSESIRVTPKSIHLSMSMSSINSDTASSVTSSRRRSLFMEQMGDKDIVKRAFKTFQNRVNQLPSSDGRSSPKQIRTPESGQKASTSMTSQKENERSRKAAEKINPARGRLGPTWKSLSSGSLKGVIADERRQKAAPSSVALRSDERAERRKEFFKNLEEKSNAREAERTQLGSKSKEVKDAEMKKIRQNLSFKAKPMPSFYRAQGASKSTSEKDAVKNGTQRRPDSHR